MKHKGAPSNMIAQHFELLKGIVNDDYAAAAKCRREAASSKVPWRQRLGGYFILLFRGGVKAGGGSPLTAEEEEEEEKEEGWGSLSEEIGEGARRAKCFFLLGPAFPPSRHRYIKKGRRGFAIDCKTWRALRIFLKGFLFWSEEKGGFLFWSGGKGV